MPQPQSTFINLSANDMTSYQREDGLLDKCAIPSFFSTLALEIVPVSEEQRSGVLLNATLSSWELDSMLPHFVPIFLFPSFSIPSWSLFLFAYKITKCSPLKISLFLFGYFPLFSSQAMNDSASCLCLCPSSFGEPVSQTELHQLFSVPSHPPLGGTEWLGWGWSWVLPFLQMEG